MLAPRFLLLALIALTTTGWGQSLTLTGRCVEQGTNQPLIGVAVYAPGTSAGAFTDLDGAFQMTVRGTGELAIEFQMIGYAQQSVSVTLPASGAERRDLGEIALASMTIGLEEAQVIASVALDRATPVAVSTLDARTIEEVQGDRELVETLNITPGVYATKGGGGFGDSRINIRGFDQRNVAVLINGIPVNDMENGWVYWSNWAGLGDAVSTMQVQRGLGASKLAINSVGGTLNIITKATDVERGASLVQSVTDYGRYKTMLSLSTGVMENGWAVSAVGSRTTGNAYVDATFIDAWSYFLTAAKDFGGQRLVFTAIGAPQTHGQRRGNLTVERFNDLQALGYEGHRWNDDWGLLNGEVLNARVNHYHKPQVALNHYWQVSDRTHLATSAYASFGRGWGSRYDGTSNPRLSETLVTLDEYGDAELRTVKTTLNWDYLYQSNSSNTQPVTYAANQIAYDEAVGAWSDTLHMAGDPVTVDGQPVVGGRTRSSLERAHNDHFWTGVLSTLHSERNEKVNLIAGIDARFYSGKHYTTVDNLLGGDFYLQSFSSTDGYGVNPDYALMARPGDVVDYDDVGRVGYAGGFGQIEYHHNGISAFAAATLSYTTYRRIDPYKYFRYEETGVQPVTTVDPLTGVATTADEFVYGIKSERAGSIGYNAKAGGSIEIGERSNAYVNAGYYSRAPFLPYVFTNFSNILTAEQLTNEKVLAAEVGYRVRFRKLAVDLNAYHTQWRDKTILSAPLLRPDGTEYRAFIRGLTQTHDGIELEVRSQPTRWLEVGGMASFGNWRWENNVEAAITAEEGGAVIDSLYIYSAGLKVSDAPQSQIGFLANTTLPSGIRLGASYVYNWNLFAQFNVDSDRTNPDYAGLQPVELPAYGYLDVRASKVFRLDGWNCRVGINVQNALDNIYMNEADETFFTDPFTGDKLQGTVGNGRLEGYWSYGRTFSLSVKVEV